MLGTINDFSRFPLALEEVRVGSGFWYHEDTQAFFDDLDQYMMIKAMCTLSGSVCDTTENQPREGGLGPRHRLRIKSIEQLKCHLYQKHKLNMCSLCLEGRKIFICEQNLNTKAQLNQHILTGDTEVDGSESERGGLAGHSKCEFCRYIIFWDDCVREAWESQRKNYDVEFFEADPSKDDLEIQLQKKVG